MLSKQRTKFSADRFFRVNSHLPGNSGWYYEAREGVCGPFPSRAMAEYSLALLAEMNPRPRTRGPFSSAKLPVAAVI